MGRWLGRGYAVGAGAFGSLGAVFGKLTFEETGVLSEVAGGGGAQLEWLLRVVSFAMVFVPNAGMWACFVRALSSLPSVEAALINTASNLVFSAAWGALLFGEALSVRWLVGSACIGAGLICMTAASTDHPTHPKAD